eukprot:evm.model.scf_1746.2 EVM.evm.TU.scf_1746.2   scf_1746:15045-30981(-)
MHMDSTGSETHNKSCVRLLCCSLLFPHWSSEGGGMCIGCRRSGYIVGNMLAKSVLERRGRGRRSADRTVAVTVLMICILCTAPSALQALKGVAESSSVGETLPEPQAHSQTDLDLVDSEGNRFPYVVRLWNDGDKTHRCGGVLIRSGLVLTAAHCIADVQANPLVVLSSGLGGQDREKVQVTRVREMHIHPQYAATEEQGNRGAQHDIALLELGIPLNISAPSLADVPPGSKGLAIVCNAASGTEERWLAAASEVSSENCSPSTSKIKCGALSMSPLTCHGDSGGPILLPSMRDGKLSAGDPQEDMIHGIISHGMDCSNRDDTRPSGEYVRVASVRDWIEEVPSAPEKGASPSQQEETGVVPDGRAPYMVSVRRPGTRDHVCSGVLVGAQWLLTAAHCVDGSSQYSATRNPIVHVGEVNAADAQGAQAIAVVKSIIHHKWDGQQRSPHNVALLKLQEAVGLPTPQLLSDLVILRVPQKLSALGYGGIAPPEMGAAIFSRLKMEEQSFLDVETSNREAMWNGSLPEGMFSGLNNQRMASCMVDSGSPLMLMDSPGYRFDQGKPKLDFFAGMNVDGAACGTPDKPDIYVDIRRVWNWVIEQMQETPVPVPYTAGPVPLGRFPYLARVPSAASRNVELALPKIDSAGKDGVELRSASCMGVLVRPDVVLTTASCLGGADIAMVVLDRDLKMEVKEIQRVDQDARGTDLAVLVLAREVHHRRPVLSTQTLSAYGHSRLFGFKSNGDMAAVDIALDGTVSNVELAPGSPILDLDPSGPYKGCPLNDVVVGIACRRSAANGKNGNSGASEQNLMGIALCTVSTSQDWIDGGAKSEIRPGRGHDIAKATGMVALGFAVTTNKLPIIFQQVIASVAVAGVSVALWMEGVTMVAREDRIAIGISLAAISLKVFMNSSKRLRNWGFGGHFTNSNVGQKTPADPKAKGAAERSREEAGSSRGSAAQQ